MNLTLDQAIEQMKAIYDYMGGITNVNGTDVHPPSILAAMMKAKADLANHEMRRTAWLAALTPDRPVPKHVGLPDTILRAREALEALPRLAAAEKVVEATRNRKAAWKRMDCARDCHCPEDEGAVCEKWQEASRLEDEALAAHAASKGGT